MIFPYNSADTFECSRIVSVSFLSYVTVERRASFRMHEGSSDTLKLRIVLSEIDADFRADTLAVTRSSFQKRLL